MRCIRPALAVLATPFVCSLALVADTGPPNYSGTWELESSQGQAGPAVTYTIQDKSGQISFTEVVRGTDGKDITSQFSCKAGGTQCDFDEGGHKAHVSLWYNGATLVILKTDGPKEDAVTEWHLTLGPGGKTMDVELEHIEPADKSEKMVFTKKA
ncbi:MAG: hypothetical protein JOY54_13940 [Acidobacteriaceae bacterium]|nr:hypothetical protein [Acidobacteriaceae bacterium]